MNNPNCDGSGPCSPGEVRVLPTSKNSWGSNTILCRSCFQREIQWRRERNLQLSKDCRFELPAWEALEVYGENNRCPKCNVDRKITIAGKAWRCLNCGQEWNK